jgi:hypothetical protein
MVGQALGLSIKGISIAYSGEPALYQTCLDRFPGGLFRDIAEVRIASLTSPKERVPTTE